MQWDQLVIEQLIQLGLPVLRYVGRSIFLGCTQLRSEIVDSWTRKHAERRVYRATELLDLWRHVYGPTWTWDDQRGDRLIKKAVRVELRGVTLHEYLSTRPGIRYALGLDEYRQRAQRYFPESYKISDEEQDCVRWGREHADIGILDIRYESLLSGSQRRYLLGATAGDEEGSPSSFPVVVSERLHQQLDPGLQAHGAVRVERIVGTINMGDERFVVPFRRALHRDPVFLDADDDQKLIALDQPHTILGDGWTVADIDGQRRILSFTFPLGVLDWERKLQQKCAVAEEFCRQHGGHPLVDFDAQHARFASARFSPETVAGWYESIVEQMDVSP
jgi:hypothetical protein